jgi:hypothetical protein
VSVSVVVSGNGGSSGGSGSGGSGSGGGGGGTGGGGGVVALLVTLTTLEQGVFDDNVFALTAAQSPKIVKLKPITGAAAIDPAGLANSLRVEHLGTYVV